MLATLEWIRPCLQHRDAESCALMLRSQGSDGAALTVGGLLVLSLVLGGVAVGLNHMTFDQWAGVLTLTFLVTVTIPALSWLARKEGDPGLARLLSWGLVATVAGLVAQTFVTKFIYGDYSDVFAYSEGASGLVKLMKAGVFTTIPPGLEARPPETQRVALALSFVYLATGTSRWAGGIVFAWLSFGGKLLMWRALRRAVPEANHKRYLVLLLFFLRLCTGMEL